MVQHVGSHGTSASSTLQKIFLFVFRYGITCFAILINPSEADAGVKRIRQYFSEYLKNFFFSSEYKGKEKKRAGNIVLLKIKNLTLDEKSSHWKILLIFYPNRSKIFHFRYSVLVYIWYFKKKNLWSYMNKMKYFFGAGNVVMLIYFSCADAHSTSARVKKIFLGHNRWF